MSYVEVNINQGYKNLSLHCDTKIKTTGMLVPFLHFYAPDMFIITGLKLDAFFFFMKFHKAIEA